MKKKNHTIFLTAAMILALGVPPVTAVSYTHLTLPTISKWSYREKTGALGQGFRNGQKQVQVHKHFLKV